MPLVIPQTSVMSQDEFVHTVAELVAGLAVPVSLSMPLGAAREPWQKLHDLAGFGWHDADMYEAILREALGLPSLSRPTLEEV
jgi:hypothetical protein